MVHKKISKNQLKENRLDIISKIKQKLVANSMTKEAEKELTKSNKKLNNISTLVKFTKKQEKHIEGGRSMRGFSKKDRKEYRKIKWKIS